MDPQLTASLNSFIRVAASATVAAVLTWLVSHGWHMSAAHEALTASIGTAVLTAVYYGAVHALETLVHRRFGYLFGVPHQPVATPAS